MTAPFGHGIELDAVGKLHVEFVKKARELLVSFALTVGLVYRLWRSGRKNGGR